MMMMLMMILYFCISEALWSFMKKTKLVFVSAVVDTS